MLDGLASTGHSALTQLSMFVTNCQVNGIALKSQMVCGAQGSPVRPPFRNSPAALCCRCWPYTLFNSGVMHQAEGLSLGRESLAT